MREITIWTCGLCADKSAQKKMMNKDEICAHVCKYLEAHVYPSQQKEHAEALKRFYKALTVVHNSKAGWRCGLCADNGIQEPIISTEQLDLHACSHLEQYVLPGQIGKYAEELQRFYDTISVKTIAVL